MSEPRPIWKYTLQDRDGNLISDLDVPDEIEVEYTWNLGPIPEFPQLIADAFLPFIQAVNEHADAMARLVQELELLRMKMIGRRYQAIFAVLVVVVYLIVEMVTR